MESYRPELLRAVVGQLPRLAVVCLPLLLYRLLGGAAALLARLLLLGCLLLVWLGRFRQGLLLAKLLDLVEFF